MTTPPNPCPRSPRVSVVRHDLRNPLGEIQGFADILAEEARELGHTPLVPDLQALSHASGELLKQLNQTLTDEHLAANPGASAALCQALQLFSQETAAAATALHARCAQLEGQPFLEDLVRIRESATQLGEHAPTLLGGMFDPVPTGLIDLD